MIQVPTPLQQIHHPLLESKKLTIYVKRDDLTHPEIMGNKWRKLKYNIEEALRKGQKKLITMGGAFSNHIAATAAAAHDAGMLSLGIIRGEELDAQSNPTLRFASSKNMELHFVSRADFRHLREDPSSVIHKHPSSYFLPEGGTNSLAIKGCGEILHELVEDFDLISCPIGTGGTYCGLASQLEDHQSLLGFSALKGGFIVNEVENLMMRYGIQPHRCTINTSYHFGGYGKTTPELIEFITWFKENFQIQLDPIYTGKSFFGVWDMVKKNKFEKNLRIVLLHTGGLQGIEGFNRKNQNIIQ